MCGIFGVYPHKDAARLTYLGLYALQHRGEESAGIITYNGKKIHLHKALGLVSDVFDDKLIKTLHGDLAVGHVIYHGPAGRQGAAVKVLQHAIHQKGVAGCVAGDLVGIQGKVLGKVSGQGADHN